MGRWVGGSENHERAAFYYRRQFTFRKVSPISGHNHDRFAVPRFLFPPPSFCTTLRTTAFDLAEAHNLIRRCKPACQFDDENLVFRILFPNLYFLRMW